MTKKEFINKHWLEIYRHLCAEGYDMGCDDDNIDDYVKDCYCFIFAGTKKEVEDELKEDGYTIIAQDNDWMLVETFNGVTYDGTDYGII